MYEVVVHTKGWMPTDIDGNPIALSRIGVNLDALTAAEADRISKAGYPR